MRISFNYLILIGTCLVGLPGFGATATYNNGWSGGSETNGHPLAGDDIVIQGGDLTWDTSLPASVQSWVQNVSYSNTITFHTTHSDYDTAFTQFVIVGSCTLNGGTWEHRSDQPSGDQQQRYWLNVRIGGSLSLASNVSINVDQAGFNNAGPGQGNSQRGASHGGAGGISEVCYGDYRYPTAFGSSAGGQGGGAILLDVTGGATINGSIEADGRSDGDRSSAGGSIYLKANNLTGIGILKADGGNSGSASGGGRVAVILTGPGQDFSGFNGTMQSIGGSSSRKGAACGTVYMQTGDGRRIMLLDNGEKTSNADKTTRIPQPSLGENNWVLDEINVRGGGVLDVTSNAVLTLTTNALVNDGATRGYVRMSGSIFNFADPLTLSTNTGLIIDGTHTLTGNVCVASGGLLTHSANPSSSTETYKMDLSIIGDLTVELNGAIDVDERGFRAQSAGHGGPGRGSGYGGAAYGGRGATSSQTYGSILSPHNLGGPVGSWPGGGAVKIRVSGTTTIDGVISSDGQTYGDRSSAAGSVFLTTGALDGSGDIRADSGNVSVSSGGGRVAVVITNSGADFSGYTGTISAHAKEVSSATAPGTVCTSHGGANHKVLIENEGRLSAGTDVPPLFEGDATYPAPDFAPEENYSDTTFIVYDGGRIAVRKNQALGGLILSNHNGFLQFDASSTQFVGQLEINSTNFAPGTLYSSSNLNAMAGGSFVTSTGFVFVGLFIENKDPNPFDLTEATLNGNLGTLGGGNPLVEIYWGLSDETTSKGTWDHSASFGIQTSTGLLSTNVNLSSNRVYFYRFYASNSTHDAWATPTTYFLPGFISLAGTDLLAHEDGPDTGTVTVQRPATATNGPTVVHYTVSGTASNGVDYEYLGGMVTIAVGQASAPIVVTPLPNYDFSNETVSITLSNGLYLLGSPLTQTVTIQNSSFLTNFNVWIGNSATDTNSWSQKRLPTASDKIMLSGFSSADLTWSSALTDEVVSWTQSVFYSGEVTFGTTYPAYDTAFTNLHIPGNVSILGGAWTHTANGNGVMELRQRLHVTVGGDLDIGPGASISGYQKGFQSAGPDQGGGNGGGSYGGRGWVAVETYGSILTPELFGSSGGGFKAGGSIRLLVAGNANIDGFLSADGHSGGDRSAAGGSVYLTAATLSGSGDISANGATASNASGGGRVAVRLTVGSFHAFNAAGGTTLALGGNKIQAAPGTVARIAGTREIIIDAGNRSTSTDTTLPPTFPGNSNYPAATYGFSDNLANATLILTNDAEMLLTADMKVARLIIPSLQESLDLGEPGDTLELVSMTINGTTYNKTGVYTTNNWKGLPVPANVTGSGEIVIGNRGTILMFQ